MMTRTSIKSTASTRALVGDAGAGAGQGGGGSSSTHNPDQQEQQVVLVVLLLLGMRIKKTFFKDKKHFRNEKQF